MNATETEVANTNEEVSQATGTAVEMKTIVPPVKSTRRVLSKSSKVFAEPHEPNAVALNMGETLQGSTTHFKVFYASSLGVTGATLANGVLAKCEQDFTQLQGFFGGLVPGGLPFTIHIQPGSNGASHASCSATDLYCDSFQGTDTVLERMLVMAEADEVMMAAQNKGWNCGYSNGEALSRVLAFEITGENFATGSAWLNTARQNFVRQNDPTDQHAASTGCAALFINWLRHQGSFQSFALNHTLAQITQAGGATPEQTFIRLGGFEYCFESFKLLLEVNFPSGKPVSINQDNPFPLPMATVPMAGLVHLQNIGDTGLVNDRFAGTQGQSRRLEGFAIHFQPPVQGLSMKYMAHLQDIGDTAFVNEGQFVGTRGQSRRLEGFAIELTGPLAATHTVMYMAHLEGSGDTGFFRDGQFCGTRGQSRRVEGILVHVAPR
jgi:hypothetical protein